MAKLSEIESFWNAQSCGEVYATGVSLEQQLRTQERARYELEPFIFDFAKFPEAAGKDVLEIGVGMGADHLQWARSRPRRLSGIDLTDRAVQFTSARLAAEGFAPGVKQGNAEALAFPDASFDIVYSYGVLHHSESPARAIDEVHRVLRAGGVARVMIYHKYSLVGFLLWLRYGLFKLNFVSLGKIYAQHLESPGTHAYSVREARRLFAKFSDVGIHRQLSVGDLMEGAAGQRHQGKLLNLARRIWPRWAIRRFFSSLGLFLLIEARK
jgi:SAM-dependent methyltransferase